MGGNLSSFVLEEQRVQSPTLSSPGLSPASHSLPPRSRGRTQPCGRPTGSGPVRRGSTAGLYPARAAREPQHQPDPPAAQPRRRPPPAQRAAGLLSGGSHLQPPRSQRGSKTPRKAPHRGRARQGPRHPRRARRAPRTHRRRRLLRPPAPQQQHQAAGGQAAAPAPRLHRGRSGAPGPALRRGHSPARAARLPAGSSPRPPRRHRPPLCRTRPLLPAQVLPGLQYSSAPGAGGVGHAATAPSRRDRDPPTLPSGAAVLSAPRAGAASPRPAPPPGGRLDPGLFSAAEVAGVGGWKGSCCQCRVAPQEGRAAGAGLARLSLGPPGPAQVRRLGGDRANFLPGHAVRG